MIKPTIGRVVWYKRPELSDQFLSAQIAYVHNDELINVGFLHSSGEADYATSVYLHPGTPEDCPSGACCWMPYQKAQAEKDKAAS